MIKFEDIKKANESIITTDVKGKDYAEVNQRIKAFRMLYPDGIIETNILSLQDGICVIRAEVGYYLTMIDDDKIETKKIILGTGTAYEKEGSTFINKTSYIENCETSAVGRALAMCGIGIDTSIASAEEVENAIKQQEEGQQDPKGKENLKMKLEELIAEKDADRDAIIKYYKVKDLNSMTMAQMNEAITHLEAK